ncbi:protein DpdD [Micromonospora sp. WMMD1128]|uniref:protein DpdD n=1 Tax=Micromonospora sp. WMMD1128 TaxID=3015150 RepID=UPI00248B95BC|nr:protein DpdD [Micromonospora sp. WMMD1128]WBB72594.1 protein DpdD [Micromonospora sp. WMMD1128]
MDVDTFLDHFFGPGNAAWPMRDPRSPAAGFLADYLALLTDQSDVPYILPRNEPGNPRKYVYVIPRLRRQATAVREWLTAFVVPSHAAFVSRPEALRAGDLVDDAVAAFVGHRRVYVLEHPQESSRDVWAALARMRRTIKQRPATYWSEPVPVGRLLAEFDLAMAAGDHRATAELLARLEGTGLSGMNLTYLAIKRLARLGSHGELLRLPALRDVVATRPPAPVREAILDAIHSTALAGPLADGNTEAARQAVVLHGEVVPALADGPLAGFGVEALAVIALAASATADRALWDRLRHEGDAWQRLGAAWPDLLNSAGYPASVAERPATLPPLSPTTTEEAPAEGLEDNTPPVIRPSAARVGSWLELVRAIANSQDIGALIAEEAWRSWPPAAASDSALAQLLDGLDNDGAERAWMIVGAFVDSDGYGQPASHTAQAFLTNALTHNRFRSNDMAGIVALLEITLRGGLPAAGYRSLLDDLGAESDRWISVSQASVVLDICDVVARAPSPDNEARLRLFQLLLAPLALQRGRLEADQLALARLINDEFDLGLVWTSPTTQSPSLNSTPTSAGQVLLYSLDEGALRRASSVLERFAPALNVQLSNDHVGSRQLKQWVQRADIIVMATRCATHAATGFIRSTARPDARIREAEGAGSASLLRAVTAALSESGAIAASVSS